MDVFGQRARTLQVALQQAAVEVGQVEASLGEERATLASQRAEVARLEAQLEDARRRVVLWGAMLAALDPRVELDLESEEDADAVGLEVGFRPSEDDGETEEG